MAPRCLSCCPWREHGEPLLPRAQPRVEPMNLGSRMRSDSETSAARRIQALIEESSSVLNRGLGALKSSHHIQPEQGGAWCSPAVFLLILGVLITFPSAISLEIYYFSLTEETFLKPDPQSRSDGLSRVVAMPLTCAAVNFLIVHIRKTTFWWDRNEARCCCCDPLAFWPMFLAVLVLGRSACLKAINENPADKIAFYIETVIALVCLKMYYALLDQINAIIKGMANEQDMINKTPPVRKMQGLVRNITRSGRPEKDVVYCFANTNTVPAEVLSYVWWLYYFVGKVLGAGITFAVFMGVSNSVIGHFLFGGIALSAATASGFLFELGPNTLSLFRLSLNKPFYVGDLVTLNINGAMDSPTTSIMGFVENITMMYVVVRNFEMKQTWIPHKSFSGMIIQNWTRRPSKTVLLNIGISCRCPVKKVKQLADFGMRWIQASPEIQQANYRKCHITKVGNGYNIEVIFLPSIGVSHRGIRQKFLVAFMTAGERMQIPFVPLLINQNFCDENCTAPQNSASYVIDSSKFDDLLPDPEDRLPKGVGLGFRQFPEEHANLAEVAAQLVPTGAALGFQAPERANESV
mmetsp:Transcript_82379/g.236705  ORF Transcript_82379/g.236705 Transcript_82379/m.236705 type:complete len:578 (-) Transcript_82379:76-1809(-)